MPSVTDDAREITNCILECLSEAYPKFDSRLIKADNRKEEKVDLPLSEAQPRNPAERD